MIYIHNQQSEPELAGLVKQGFVRSYTSAQVDNYSGDSKGFCVHVFINPVDDDDLEIIQQISSTPAKIIILGRVSAGIAEVLGVRVEDLTDDAYAWDRCDAAPIHGFSESSARIKYGDLPYGLECHIVDRPLLRYDFAREWNNLGYGHVRTDGSIWSLACKANFISSNNGHIASVLQGDEYLTVFSSLSTLKFSDILWVNRPVGLVDTHEFRLFETFITNYKSDSLPCLPLIREIPYGYDAMVSMRLDCDEAISSASSLFQLYKDKEVPLSMAVKTAQKTSNEDYRFLGDIVSQGGSILSHTVNHKSNWGDDLDDVRIEAKESRKWILEHVKQVERVDFAVSPFHQNPDYAIKALAMEGYKGFISGIICNDPQYLVARAGEVWGVDNVVTHSQQCMLHGDCLLEDGEDRLAVYKRSAHICIKSGAIFGYLDHPFSERYQYGWASERLRLRVHHEWIEFLQKMGSVLFENEVKTLDHVRTKAGADIWMEGETVRARQKINLSDYPLAYEYKNSVERLV